MFQINLIEVFAILIIHWVADFVLQTHEQAINKSKSNWYLTAHVATYSVVWLLVGWIYTMALMFYYDDKYCTANCHHNYLWTTSLFVLITSVCHWITDYFTSRKTSYLFGKGDYHNGFVVVGLDQILHYTQLFLTYQLLFK